ncbi:MAG: ABC transporter ATP-binding protein [Syntrophaceae bacterium]|nr:ABC transporter ATP-binding protein [Syntrophaceae bacterium]
MENCKAKIEIRNVSKVFGKGAKSVVALDDVNLEIPENKFTTIVGPSGCGKSTLLYMLAGFEKPSGGEILLDGKLIDKPAPDRGFVFQDFALFPWRTVLGNVTFGLTTNGRSKKEAKEIAMEYINLVNLSGFEHAYPHTLSGGMKQRVAIARALAYDPEVLLMDEPFGALDAQTRKYMQKELVDIWDKLNKTVVFVTHSVIEAVHLSDIIVVLTARPGKVKGIISADIPRPRKSTNDDFLAIRKHTLDLLEEEVQKEIKMDHL